MNTSSEQLRALSTHPRKAHDALSESREITRAYTSEENARPLHRRLLLPAALVCTAAAILCIPMLVNGFPFTQPIDSLNYVQYFKGFSARSVARQFSYAFFIKLTGHSGSLFGAAAAQALLTAYLLWRVWLHFFGFDKNRTFLLAIAATTGFSTTGFFVCRIHSDAMLVPMMLSAFLLLSNSYFSYSAAIIYAATASTHISYWLLAGGLAGSYLVYFGLRKRLLCRRTLATLLLAALLPFLHQLARNETLSGSNRELKHYAAKVILSKLAAFELLPAYLDEACRTRSFVLCRSREQLKNRRFVDVLWNKELWHPMTPKEEFYPLTAGSLAHKPVQLLHAAAAAVLSQLRKTAELDRLTAPPPSIRAAMAAAYPKDRPRIAQSLQLTLNGLGEKPLLRAMTAVQCVLLALFLLLFLWSISKKRRPASCTLAGLYLFFLAANTVIIALFSEPLGRYQNRIAWLGVFIGIILLVELLSGGRPGRAAEQIESIP